jgi:hypothetical protein
MQICNADMIVANSGCIVYCNFWKNSLLHFEKNYIKVF